MREHGIGSVVVVDGNRPVGILTERDLLRAAAAAAEPSTGLVRDWMADHADCVQADASIDDAWRQLDDHGYRHIPVTVGDELKGIISIRDLMALAQLRPAGELAATAPPGLKGVVVAETQLGDVRGTEGFYHYRQYAAPDLAAQAHVRRRVAPADRRRAAHACRQRRVHGRGRTAARAARRCARRAAGHRRAARPTPVAALRTAISLLAAIEDLPASLDVDRTQLRARCDAPQRGGADAHCGDPSAAQRPHPIAPR